MSLLDSIGFKPRRLGYVVVAIVLGYLGFNAIRNTRMDALGRAALDRKADPAVVKQLAGYRGSRSEELLLLVAGASQSTENRIAAIQALVNRHAGALVSRLAELLVPQESLAVRKEIAQALYSTGCSTECVKNVLYFEERMWHGARPAEEVLAELPDSTSPPEKELQNVLDEVLRKNRTSTMLVLAKVYGLATDFPSPFAVETVQRLGLKEACPLLMHTYLSVSDQVRGSPEYKYVSNAVSALRCPGPQPPK